MLLCYDGHMQDEENKSEEQEPVETSLTTVETDNRKHATKKRRSGPVMWVILIVLLGLLGSILFTNPQISQWITENLPSNGTYSQPQPKNDSSKPINLSEAQIMGGVTIFSIGLAPTITAVATVLNLMLLMYIGSDLTKIKRDIKKITDNKLEED